MIRQAVLLPCALRSAEPSGGMPLMVLQDLMAAGLVLVDSPAALTKIELELAGWAQGPKTRAQALVVRLDAAHRFVEASSGPPRPAIPCEVCRALLRVAAANDPSALFYGSVCTAIAPSMPGGCERVAVEAYPSSAFRAQVVDEASVRVPAGTPQAEFGARYLVPVLEYAKRVSLYDRHIGRTLFAGGNPAIKAGYSETIEWIASTYSQVKRRDPGLLRVVTGIDMTWGPVAVDAAITALDRFRHRISDTYGVPFEIELKPEVLRGQGFREMAHARYLVTDQIGLGVERGFDLLYRAPGPRGAVTLIKEVVLSRLTHEATVALETDARRYTSHRTLGRPVS